MEINCDIGEVKSEIGIKRDIELMAFMDAANIACGCHAGDYKLMDMMIEAAIENDVKIGAHPGYLDPENFGRQSVSMPIWELKALLIYQIGAIEKMVLLKNRKLNHVKLHGALYNLAMVDFLVADTLVETIKNINEELIIFGMPNSALENACKNHNMPFYREFFGDRFYDKTLLASRASGGTIEDRDQFEVHCQRFLEEGVVKDIHGDVYNMSCKTICIHSDHPNSLDNIKRLHQMIKKSMGHFNGNS